MHTITQGQVSTTAVTNDAVIALTGVRRHFGHGDRRVQAVDDVSLTITRGEVVALLGPNGAGKTTTLDMLLGLSEPSEGTVRVFGQRPDQATARGAIAAVLQTGGLLSDLTVRETVSLVASLHGRAALARVPEVLDRADLTGLDGPPMVGPAEAHSATFIAFQAIAEPSRSVPSVDRRRAIPSARMAAPPIP